ncbi:MAG: hypothetical protein ACJAU6_002964 [Alphaproteobacteria bacterium]|jgi:hypothetical protein
MQKASDGVRPNARKFNAALKRRCGRLLWRSGRRGNFVREHLSVRPNHEEIGKGPSSLNPQGPAHLFLSLMAVWKSTVNLQFAAKAGAESSRMSKK